MMQNHTGSNLIGQPQTEKLSVSIQMKMSILSKQERCERRNRFSYGVSKYSHTHCSNGIKAIGNILISVYKNITIMNHFKSVCCKKKVRKHKYI